MTDRMINPEVSTMVCIHNVGLTPGMWCGGCEPVVFVEVITRYGGVTHLARKTRGSFFYKPNGRHFTLCMGTSSWTVESWEKNPDHPIHTTEEIKALPPCSRCQAVKETYR